jgi:subtilisin family serine protease
MKVKKAVVFTVFLLLATGVITLAAQNEYVRVIVKMDVPGIETLTARSNGFKTGVMDGAYLQAAASADAELDRAISRARDEVLHQLNGMPYTITRTYSTLPYTGLTVTAGTLDKLQTLPQVLTIVEDKAVARSAALPPAREIQTIDNTGDTGAPMLDQTVSIVGADLAWSYGYTGSGWYVAVLDTGIMPSHEMFQGKPIVEQCYASGEDSDDRENGGCPNGKTEMSGPGSAAHYEARYYHGSHVAGIAAGNNHRGRFGVAKDAGIIAINVFSYFDSENAVLSWNSDQLKGLEFLYLKRAEYKIAAANLSLGGYVRHEDYCDSDMLRPAIDNLSAVGIATVISGGNEAYCGAVAAPACVRSAVAVGAVDKSDNEYWSGNWHDDMIDLIAPCVIITSAAGYGNDSYAAGTGTSMAAPHVAGAWAIMKQFSEQLTVDDILGILQATGTPIYSGKCSSTVPRTRFNVGNALKTLLFIAPPTSLSALQTVNRSLLQSEYINIISWEPNPFNHDKNVAQYKIYALRNSQLNLLAQVDASTSSYMHRDAGNRQPVTYAVTAVDDLGNESYPTYFNLEF